MAEQSGPHFRRVPRCGVGLPVQYRCGRSQLRYRGLLQDVSLGGAFVESAHVPPVGAEVELTVRAPSCWEAVTLQGQVRWVRRVGVAGFGVRFLDLSPRAAHALHDLLDAASYGTPWGGEER